jgi:hypothetical protein
VLDSSSFVKLLSICTSPGKVLNALTKDNLRTLLVKSPPDDSLQIAKEVLKHQTHEATADSDGFSSPYRTAVWMIILLDVSVTEPKKLLEVICADINADEAKLKLTQSRTVDALIWASTYMNDTLVCYPCIKKENDPRQRTALLRKTLIYLSHVLMARGDARVPALWQNMFAAFLRDADAPVPGKSTKKPSIIKHVALHADNTSHMWPQPVLYLWAIAHKKSNPTQIKELWTRHREIFYREEAGKNIIDPVIATGVLSLNAGTLPIELKMEILTNGSAEELDIDDPQSATALVSDAVQLIAQTCINENRPLDESKFAIANGAFREHVLAAARKYMQDHSG